MNRGQLFNDVWKMMTRNPALWIVALIATGIGTAISFVVSNLSVEGGTAIVVNLLSTAINLAVTAFVSGAVIWMVNAIADRQTISVNDGFQAGSRKIIPLVFLALALMLPIWIIILIFSGSFLSVFGSAIGQPRGISPTTLLPLFVGGFLGLGIAAVIIGIITGLIQVGAERSIVLENLTVFAALKRGWQVARRHVSDFVGIGVYMLIVGLGIALLYSCTIGLMLSSSINQMVASGDFTAQARFSAPVLLSTLVNLVLDVLISTLFSGVWTLAYREWTAHDVPAEQPATIKWD